MGRQPKRGVEHTFYDAQRELCAIAPPAIVGISRSDKQYIMVHFFLCI